MKPGAHYRPRRPLTGWRIPDGIETLAGVIISVILAAAAIAMSHWITAPWWTA